MWKYVSRRIRDSVERTYNVLETRKTWTCGEKVPHPSGNAATSSHTEEEDSIYPHQHNANSVYVFADSQWNGSSSSGKDDFKQSYNNDCKFQQSFLGALTWSSAIVCGWYTSQILCMRRRNLRDGWNSRCNYSKTLLTPGQAFHTNVLSRWVLTAPEHNNKSRIWFDSAFDEKYDAPQKRLYDVNNDTPVNSSQKKADTTKSSQGAAAAVNKTVDSAVKDLLEVVGDIEFQLGVQNIEAERFGTAATHFKLGTTHHHVGATFNLGICYELGLGVERNLKLALECYQVASSMGHAKATYNVGIFHVHGLGGLPKNRRAARQFFIEAAKLGQVDAQKALGIKAPEQAVQQNTKFTQQNAIFQTVAVV